ncbi:unnamed protein product [Rotaria sp. Silwood1]|nr:unnamed protein product [Rotaria sp. Silwood1]
MRDLTVTKEANNQEKFIDMLNNVIQVLKPIEPASCYNKHPLIIHVLHDSFIKLLNQTMNQNVEHTLTELAQFFEQYVAPTLVTSGNNKQSLIDGLVLCLAKKVAGKTSHFVFFITDEPCPTEESLDRSLHTLLRTLEKYKDDNTSLTWVDILIDCVCSSTFVNTFRSLHSNEDDDLSENQKLLLIDRVMQVYQYNDLNTVTYLMQRISSRSLPVYAQLLFEFIPPRKSIHVRVLHHFVKMLQFLAIDNDIRHQFVKNHELIIDSLLVILQDDILWENINDIDTEGLFNNASNYIFLLSLEHDLLPIIKSKPNVAKCMLRLTTAQADLTQFNGYRTLAMIMTEEELKQLAEPEKIIAVFIRHMSLSIDFIQHRRRLENLLLCLKSRFKSILFSHRDFAELFTLKRFGPT